MYNSITKTISLCPDTRYLYKPRRVFDISITMALICYIPRIQNCDYELVSMCKASRNRCISSRTLDLCLGAH